MAMGAFLAGVLLSESSFRHQLQELILSLLGVAVRLVLSWGWYVTQPLGCC